VCTQGARLFAFRYKLRHRRRRRRRRRRRHRETSVRICSLPSKRKKSTYKCIFAANVSSYLQNIPTTKSR